MRFDDYATKYSQVKMERRDGILQLTLHSSNAEFKWSALPHEELSYAFYDVARDHENRCVIITGTGNVFCSEMDTGGGPGGLKVAEEHARTAGIPPANWDNSCGTRCALRHRARFGKRAISGCPPFSERGCTR